MGATMRRHIGMGFGLALLMVVGHTYAFLDDDIPVPVKPKPAKRPAEESRSKPRLQSSKAEEERQEVARVAEERRKAKEDAARGPQWAESDNGADINWAEAMRYCVSKGSGWRLPTIAEFWSSYVSGHATPCGEWTCKISSNSRLTAKWFWSDESAGSSLARAFNLVGVQTSWPVETRDGRRALCVRWP